MGIPSERDLCLSRDCQKNIFMDLGKLKNTHIAPFLKNALNECNTGREGGRILNIFEPPEEDMSKTS